MTKKNELDKREIKQRLDPQAYHVTQEKGTEAPFSGQYYDTKDKGMYKCVVCGSELFSSDAKIDHDTYANSPGLAGWPSFDQALLGAVEFKEDLSHGMNRTEAVCAKCNAHLGHAFDDSKTDSAGSLQAGKHYCINSCALKLAKN